MLVTKRLILRKVEIEDAADIYEYACLDSVSKYTQEKKHENIEDSIDSIINFHFKYKERNAFSTYALELKSTGKMIGLIALHTCLSNNCFEIGFECNPKYHNQGYMQEALSKFMEYYENQVNCVVAKVLQNNNISLHLLKKLKFIEIGKNKEEIILERRFYEKI